MPTGSRAQVIVPGGHDYGSLPPDVSVRPDPPFAEGKISDRSNAEFIVANLNMISGSDVICHAVNVSPFIELRAELNG